jgi:hypothetical protein
MLAREDGLRWINRIAAFRDRDGHGCALQCPLRDASSRRVSPNCGHSRAARATPRSDRPERFPQTYGHRISVKTIFDAGVGRARGLLSYPFYVGCCTRQL